ncbi:MAG: YabP/YqfC family sporulation protein [Faecalibacterium sp.]
MSKKQRKRLTLRAWGKLLFRQPPAGFYRSPSVYLCGNQMEIEHFRRVITYDESKLCLELAHGRFTVYGDNMKICTLGIHRITLRGRFLRTDLSDQ